MSWGFSDDEEEVLIVKAGSDEWQIGFAGACVYRSQLNYTLNC